MVEKRKIDLSKIDLKAINNLYNKPTEKEKIMFSEMAYEKGKTNAYKQIIIFMTHDNEDLEKIMKYTGLTKEQIDDLKEENENDKIERKRIIDQDNIKPVSAYYCWFDFNDGLMKYPTYYEGKKEILIEIAKNMLDEDEDIIKIIKYTRLTIEDIKNYCLD